MAVVLALATPGAGAVDEELAKELKTLLLQQRQLERSAREYRSSLEMLRADDSPEAGNQNALTALSNQLDRAESRLVELDRRRKELEAELGLADAAAETAGSDAGSQDNEVTGTAQEPEPPPGSTAAASPPPRSQADSSIESEASRLTELLSGYYASEEGEPPDQRSQEAEEGDAPVLVPGKVQLTGAEGLIAIEMISERLARGPQSLRREVDIIYRVVVRRDGKLLSSSSHSLKSLGKSQYVGKIEVPGGDATITVRRNNWFVLLESDEEAAYLVTLDMPEYGDINLHLIPVAELKAEGIEDLPAWLPYLGNSPPESS